MGGLITDPSNRDVREGYLEKYGRQINSDTINELTKIGLARNYMSKLALFAKKVYGEDVDGREYLRNLFYEEIKKKSKYTPLYEVSKRYLKTSENKRLTRSQLWGKWFAPLKMWAKGGTATMIKRIEKNILKGKYKLTEYTMEDLIKKYSKQVDFLPWVAAGITEWVNNDFDFMLGIVGYEGTGKSSLALALARDLTYYGFDFDMVDNIFFGSTPVDYIIDRIENDEHQVFIFDEADAFFDSRNFMKKEQKKLVTSIVMNRARNHVYILATPDISSIDIRFRERRLTHVFHLLDRNLVALLIKHNSGRSQDGFMYREIDYMLRHSIPTAKVLARQFARLETCYGLFRLNGPPISSMTYELYKRFKMELNRMSESVGKDISRNLVGSFIKYVISSKKYKPSVIGFSRRVGVAPSIVYSLLGSIAKQMAPKHIEDTFDSETSYYKKPGVKDVLGTKGVTSITDRQVFGSTNNAVTEENGEEESEEEAKELDREVVEKRNFEKNATAKLYIDADVDKKKIKKKLKGLLSMDDPNIQRILNEKKVKDENKNEEEEVDTNEVHS